jgi:hypothetical protein
MTSLRGDELLRSLVPSPTGGIAPKVLEVVEITGLLQEHVYYEVAVVHKDPAGVVQALHGTRASGAGHLKLALDFVSDGVDLARVGATGDHERVCQPQKVLDAEHERVATKFRRGGSGC